MIESNLRCPRCHKRLAIRDQPDPGLVKHECLSCGYTEAARLARPRRQLGPNLMEHLRDEVRGG